MATDLTKTLPGDTLAIRQTKSWSAGADYLLLLVVRCTDTQVICTNKNTHAGEWRFRRKDGKRIGEHYQYAEIATPELIAKIQHQAELAARNLAARQQLNDLEGKHLHQLKLTLEQTEALAMAWTAIKAMAA